MATAAVLAKASRLLVENRVRFADTETGFSAQVRGDSGDYSVEWDGQRWKCNCLCSHARCAHIEACKIVVRVFGVQT